MDKSELVLRVLLRLTWAPILASSGVRSWDQDPNAPLSTDCAAAFGTPYQPQSALRLFSMCLVTYCVNCRRAWVAGILDPLVRLDLPLLATHYPCACCHHLPLFCMRVCLSAQPAQTPCTLFVLICRFRGLVDYCVVTLLGSWPMLP